MTEQLTFFTDGVTETDVLNWLVRRYEQLKALGDEDWYKNHNFDDWVLYEFSHYSGGSICDEQLEAKGIRWFDFSSTRGLRIQGYFEGEAVCIIIPKAKVLKAFGIRDDHKDVLEDCE